MKSNYKKPHYVGIFNKDTPYTEVAGLTLHLHLLHSLKINFLVNLLYIALLNHELLVISVE